MSYNFPIKLAPGRDPGTLILPSILTVENADRFQYTMPQDFVVWGAGQYTQAIAEVIGKNLEHFHQSIETSPTKIGPLRLFLNPHRGADGEPSDAAKADLYEFNENRKSKYFPGQKMHPLLEASHDSEYVLRDAKHIIIGVDGSNFQEASKELIETIVRMRERGDLSNSIQFVFVTKGLPTTELSSSKMSIECPSDYFAEKLKAEGGWRPGDCITVQHGAAFAKTVKNDGSYMLAQADRVSGNTILPENLRAALSRRNGIVQDVGSAHSVELAAILKNVAAAFCQYAEAVSSRLVAEGILSEHDLVIVPLKTRSLIAQELNKVHYISMDNHKDPKFDIFNSCIPLKLDYEMTVSNAESRNAELGRLLAKHLNLSDARSEIESNRGGKVTFESLQTLDALVPWLKGQFDRLRGLGVNETDFPLLVEFNHLVALRGNNHTVLMDIEPDKFNDSMREIMIKQLEVDLIMRIIESDIQDLSTVFDRRN